MLFSAAAKPAQKIKKPRQPRISRLKGPQRLKDLKGGAEHEYAAVRLDRDLGHERLSVSDASILIH